MVRLITHLPAIQMLTKSSNFLGAGITDSLFHEISPELASRIWSELDIVPMVFRVGRDYQFVDDYRSQRVDDQADSMARNTVMLV